MAKRAPLTKDQILAIVKQARDEGSVQSERLGKKMETLGKYYHNQPYGDEVKGNSRFVTSEVSDIVETMTPQLLGKFTQGPTIFNYTANTSNQADIQEAEEKTALVNDIFLKQNKGVSLLQDFIKQALWQYIGVFKPYYEVEEKSFQESFSGLSEAEYQALINNPEYSEVEEVELEVAQGLLGPEYTGTIQVTTNQNKYNIDLTAADEFLIAPSARSTDRPAYIGQKTPVTRSALVEMGFDREIVDKLPSHDAPENTGIEQARQPDLERDKDVNSIDRAADIIYLTELYIYIDADQDGISELYQVFEAGDRLMQDPVMWGITHPYCAAVPVTIPHNVIGTCPAAQVAPIQRVNSALVRHALDNIYHNNNSRNAVNDRVNAKDLLVNRPGGVIRVRGEEPIGDAVRPLVGQPQVDQINLQLDYMQSAQERRTGVSRFNGGANPDALQQTATAFKGVDEYSQARVMNMARIFAECLEELADKIIELVVEHQDTPMQVVSYGKALEVDPSKWRGNVSVKVSTGIASGTRQEKIANLGNILERQIQAIQLQSSLSDEAKAYNTLSQIVHEMGLKDVSQYFNDPTKPDELLQVENEQLASENEELKAQLEASQNQLAEAELVRAQASLETAQLRKDTEEQKNFINAAKLEEDSRQFDAKLAQDDEHFRQEQVKDLTKMELDSNKDVPGSSV